MAPFSSSPGLCSSFCHFFSTSSALHLVSSYYYYKFLRNPSRRYRFFTNLYLCKRCFLQIFPDPLHKNPVMNHMFELEATVLFLGAVLFGRLMGNGDDEKKISSPETEEKYSDKSAEIFSRDLLQSFLGSTSEHETMKEEEAVELKLGLSLGGEFGVVKCPKNLVRSSTVSFPPVVRDESDTSPSAVATQGSLARTSSMPVETEDEKRKRKELQSLRRTEAKKRSDKKRTLRGDKVMEVNWMRDLEREKHLSVMKKLGTSVQGPSFEASSNLRGGVDVAVAKGKGVSGWSSGGMQGLGQVVSQGSSVESTWGSSSSLTGELEREKHLPVTKKLESLVGRTFDLGGGIDVEMAKGKGVSAWGSSGMHGIEQVLSQGSSVESTWGSSSTLTGELEREKHLPVTKKLESLVGRTFDLGGGIDVEMAKGKGVSAWGSSGMHGIGQVVSQGSSVESTGGSSSSLSGELESKALQGSSGDLSPASILSLRERSKMDIDSSSTKAKENPSQATASEIQISAKKPVDTSRTRGRDTRTRSAVEDMPSVYTRGDGPNGRRVDGILYRYGRGEEVRIMCICHGMFHSPSEFVLHAGGTNVDNPLRHIIINPYSSPLL